MSNEGANILRTKPEIFSSLWPLLKCKTSVSHDRTINKIKFLMERWGFWMQAARINCSSLFLCLTLDGLHPLVSNRAAVYNFSNILRLIFFGKLFYSLIILMHKKFCHSDFSPLWQKILIG